MKMNAFVISGICSLSLLVVGCGAAGETDGTGPEDWGSFDDPIGGESVETQAEAAIACPQPWYRAGLYSNGQSCSYACYYYVQAGTYAQCTCTRRNPSAVEMWVNNCPP